MFVVFFASFEESGPLNVPFEDAEHQCEYRQPQ
jgi:hypothetical protein